MNGLRITLVAITAYLAAAYLLRPSETSRSQVAIALEAEAAIGVKPPLTVEVDPDDDTHYLHVPASDTIADRVFFLDTPLQLDFDLPAGGRYYVWARTRWKHLCANSFSFRIDDDVTRLVGNEERFDDWHWVRHELAIALTAGAHRLVIDQIEPAIDIDQILITDSATPKLPKSEAVRFEDDFRRADLRDWNFQTPRDWTAVAIDDGTSAALRLEPRPRSAPEVATRVGPSFHGALHLHARVRGSAAAANDVVLVFDYQNPSEFRAISFSGSEVSVTAISPTTTAVVATAPVPAGLARLAGHAWDLDVVIAGGMLRAYLDGLDVLAVAHPEVHGRIGLGSVAGGVDFTFAAATPPHPPDLANRFYVDGRALTVVPGFRVEAGNWRRGFLYNDPPTYSLEARSDGARAIAVSEESWSGELHAEVAIRLRADLAAGLAVRYRDATDYALVRVRPGANGEAGALELVRTTPSGDEVLAGTAIDLPTGSWRVLAIDMSYAGIVASLGTEFRLASQAVHAGPGGIALVIEPRSELPLSAAIAERPPVWMPELTSGPDFSIQIPLRIAADGEAVRLLFHGTKADDYYALDAFQLDQARAVGLRLSRQQSGVPVTFGRVKLDMAAASNAPIPGSEQYQLGVSIKADVIQTFLNGTAALATSGPAVAGRVGITAVVPPPEVEFDELEVRALGDPAVTPGSFHYDFNPVRRAAHDFADWNVTSGQWGIGFNNNPLLYALVARTGAEGRASFQRRLPLAESPATLGFAIRAIELAPRTLEVGFADLPDAPPTVTARLAIERDGDRFRSRATLLCAAKVIATATGAVLDGERWRRLTIANNNGEVAILFDDQRLLAAKIDHTLSGQYVSLTLLGPEPTILGFSRLRAGETP